MNLRGKWY